MILRQGFYARSESIVRRMHLVFLRYPSLNHIAPHLAWKTRVPLNAHVQVVISVSPISLKATEIDLIH